MPSVIEPSQETLADVFWAVAHDLRHRTRDVIEPLGVTPGQARALGVLARDGDLRPGNLAEHLRIAARSGTEVIDALEARGLVSRSPDPDDRRATRVVLTPAGREVAEAVRSAQRAEAESFFGGLPAEDRAELARILGSLRSGD